MQKFQHLRSEDEYDPDAVYYPPLSHESPIRVYPPDPATDIRPDLELVPEEYEGIMPYRPRSHFTPPTKLYKPPQRRWLRVGDIVATLVLAGLLLVVVAGLLGVNVLDLL